MKQYTIGDVYVVPKEKALRPDPRECRRQVVVAADYTREQLSLAFATKSPRQQTRGAAATLIAPRVEEESPNGFTIPTFVYPGFILPIATSDLGRHKGVLNQSELVKVAQLLSQALGIGTGTRWAPKMRSKSLRGAI